MDDVKGFKILGQEPAFFISLVEAVLILLLSLNVFIGLNEETAAIILAVFSALMAFVAAIATSTPWLSALVQLSKSVLTLAIAFGLPISDKTSASLTAIVVLVGGAFLRAKTNSVDSVVSSSSPGDKKEALELFALAPPGTADLATGIVDPLSTDSSTAGG